MQTDDKPTEGQLEFAGKLGLNVPVGITGTELRDLMDFTRDDDEPATERDRALAARYGISFTKYTGRRVLHERIFHGLDRPDCDAKLVAWFACFVYVDLVGHEPNNIETLEEVVTPVAANASVLSSIRRAHVPSLFRFGWWTDDKGLTREGASRRTVAYKAVADALVEKLGLQPRPTRRDAPTRKPVNDRADVGNPTGGGCLSAVACVALFAAFALVLA